MRKMIVFMEVGYADMDACKPLLVYGNVTEDEIAEEAYAMAVAHAESYGYYANDGYEDEEEDDEDRGTKYSDNIAGWAVDYDPEVHDMERSGGGSFERDFEWLSR